MLHLKKNKTKLNIPHQPIDLNEDLSGLTRDCGLGGEMNESTGFQSLHPEFVSQNLCDMWL